MLLFNMKTTEYIILTLSNYTDSQLSDIDSVCLTSLALARKSNDLTKCLMKVQPDSTGTYPTQISSLTKYSLSEIETIMANSEWKRIEATEDNSDDWPGDSLEIET